MLQVKTIEEANALHQPSSMHRVRKARHFVRPGALWLGSVLIVVATVALVFFAYFTAELFIQADQSAGYKALAALGVWLLLRLCALWRVHELHCQLCRGTVLREKRCLKHPEGTKLPLISHRFSSALAIFCTGHFSCMYCGTPYRLKK